MSYGKWIGGALGWAVGGPLGGVLGFAFGAIVDDGAKGALRTKGQDQYQKHYDPRGDRGFAGQRHQTRPGDFASALLVLSAAVMKADGKYMKSELSFIREFYARQFGEATAAEQVGVLKELLNKDIPVRDVCGQIRYYMEHPMRLQLLHYLFGLAQSDGQVDAKEATMIRQIAMDLGISAKDYESIQAMFYKDVAHAYVVLEIEPTATDDEVKKAYRRMAVKYHPDKVRDLGEAHQKAAQEKFIKVQEAYEAVKKERGMA